MADSKVAVVTGGSAGVGRATVRLLAEEGYDVAILARGDAGLSAAGEDVETAGRRALPLDVDVSDHDAVMEAATRVESTLGP
ncbi:MAG TPA: SDR family NAD(P)-dependent oxidoreductase, partial [Acidimicrobiales bacterium]|nr:SDR family NAD(P)-dependent oxidoreductase [Acidimicrobiales bacterium]